MAKLEPLYFCIYLLLIFGSSVRTYPLEDEIAEDEEAKLSYRLTANAVPIHYNIKLIPYLEVNNFTFDGETSVELKIQNATKTLDFHMKELTLDETETYLEGEDGQRYEGIDFAYINVTEIMTITFNKTVQPGLYKFHSKFMGIINDDLVGFYRSSYRNDDNDTVWLATTQFQATYARHAFPCWDEPAMKATFNVSIKHYPNYTALSNMPAYEQSAIDENDEKVWTHFQKTPVMSTYILAFVVSDFVRVPNSDGTINVWIRKNAVPLISFGHEVAQKADELLQRYTNSSVRVPKMDHIIIPDFSHGAMENWGLITYAERYFLYYPNKTLQSQKAWAAMVITHELTHQWFGNMVSPSWWGHIWLNEGFASYFQYYITNKIFPTWRLMEVFVPTVLQFSFDLDKHPFDEPISLNVSTPKSIEKSFSGLTYLKAASLLRMLSHVVTDDVFHRGLIAYLHQYQYSNASPDDLWGQIQNAVDETPVIPCSDFRVKDMMDTWIYQRHYPLVTVNRNYVTGEATITQEIFESRVTIENDNTTDHDDNLIKHTRWWIPINYATRTKANFSYTSPTHCLKPEQENITIDGIDTDDWLILNVQQTGHYRVNYDDRNWLKLAEYLNSPDYEKINVLNRAQIMHDAYNLVITKKLNLTIFFELTNYLSRESDYVVWVIIFDFMTEKVGHLAETAEGSKVLRPHILNLMTGIVDSMGFDFDFEDDYIPQTTRMNIREKACSLGHTECNMKANAALVEFLESPGKVYSRNVESWIFCDGMKYANESTWDKILDMYPNKTEITITSYLCCIENATVIEKYLNMTISETSPFAERDYKRIFESLFYASPAVADMTTDFVLKHWDVLISRKDMKNALPALMIQAATSKDRLDKIKSFLEDEGIKDLSLSLEQREEFLIEAEQVLDEFHSWQKSKESNSV